MPGIENWLNYLKRAWSDSLKDGNISALSMLLRDFIAYGRQAECIDEKFAEDIDKRIKVLEGLRSKMNSGEVSRSLRAILYAKRHTEEITTDYGSGFRSQTGRRNKQSDRSSDVSGEADALSGLQNDVFHRSHNGFFSSDLDDDLSEVD